jgi:hypothetical protein
MTAVGARFQPRGKMNSHHKTDEYLPDLSGLVFRTARTDDEMEAILECRWKGYRRYGFAEPAACRDSFDSHAVQYICEEQNTKRTMGCLRLVSIHHRPFELEEYFDIKNWASNGTRPAELTRFSVPESKEQPEIKFGLWKLAWLDAVARGHTHFIIWTTQYYKAMYESLGFVPYPGNSPEFLHKVLNSTPHSVMIFDLLSAPDLYRRTRPSLYRFFCEMTHANIIL